MLFRRRKPPSVSTRAAEILVPRKGWSRAIHYVRHRVSRLQGSPHAIALGFACGVAVSFTPFVGFHFVFAAVIAWAIAGNVLASAFGTFVGNPATFPLMWISSYTAGSWLLGLGGEAPLDLTFSDLMSRPLELFWPVVAPMMLGTLIVGVPISLVFYIALRPVVGAYQQRRRARLKAIAERDAARASNAQAARS